MKIFALLQYCWYIGIRWNWRVAFFLLFDDARGERKYGIDTTGADELDHLRIEGKSIDHATIYMPVAYSLLEELLHQIPAQSKTHFLDIGAGKGRAIAVAASHGFQQCTGIDFSEKLCQAARQNLLPIQQQMPDCKLNIECCDATIYPIPNDADCIFLFNPFDEFVMKAVLANISNSLAIHNRELYVIYANPQFKNLFLAHGCAEVFFVKKLKYIEASVLAYHPATT